MPILKETYNPFTLAFSQDAHVSVLMVRVEQSLNQRYVDVEKLDAKLRQLFVRDFDYNLVGNMYILSVPRELTKSDIKDVGYDSAQAV